MTFEEMVHKAGWDDNGGWQEDYVKEMCLTKKFVKDIIENHLIGYQEEATTKWSSEEEASQALRKVVLLSSILKELGLE